MKKFILALFTALLWPVIYICSQGVVAFVGMFVFAINGTVALASEGGAMIDAAELMSNFESEYINVISIYSCVLTCVIVLLYIRARHIPITEALKIRWMPPVHFVVLLTMGVALNLFTVYAMEWIPFPEWMFEQYEEAVNADMLGGNMLVSLFATGLIVPITEEIIFRCMSFGALRRGMALVTALVLQCVIFAGAHMIPLQMIYVLAAALVLGLVYIWSDNILYTIAVHVGYNGFSVIIAFLQRAAEQTDAADRAALLPYMFGSAVVLILCLLYIWSGRRREPPRQDLT